MTEMRKITAFVPARLLESAQDATGEGVTETVRRGLEALRRERFYRGMLELRGKVPFESWGADLDELRADREFGPDGTPL